MLSLCVCLFPTYFRILFPFGSLAIDISGGGEFSTPSIPPSHAQRHTHTHTLKLARYREKQANKVRRSSTATGAAGLS